MCDRVSSSDTVISFFEINTLTANNTFFYIKATNLGNFIVVVVQLNNL